MLGDAIELFPTLESNDATGIDISDSESDNEPCKFNVFLLSLDRITTTIGLFFIIVDIDCSTADVNE